MQQKEEKIAPVWPCEPLCRANGGGVASVPTNNCLRALSGPCAKAGDDCWNTFSPRIEGEPTG